VGLPEGTEGPRPTEFTAQLLQDILGLDNKPMLDRAHRTLRAKPKDGEPPRPLVIRSGTKFCAEPEKHPLFPTWAGGSRSSPTSPVAKKRAAFAAVKRELHSCPNVKFVLLYPATLRITLPCGQTHRFEDPTLTLTFIEKNIKKGVTPDTI